MTVAALATTLGVAAETAHNWLVAAGVPRRESAVAPASRSATSRSAGCTRLEGWTAAEVAAHLRGAPSTVYARLQRLGGPPSAGAAPTQLQARGH